MNQQNLPFPILLSFSIFSYLFPKLTWKIPISFHSFFACRQKSMDSPTQFLTESRNTPRFHLRTTIFHFIVSLKLKVFHFLFLLSPPSSNQSLWLTSPPSLSPTTSKSLPLDLVVLLVIGPTKTSPFFFIPNKGGLPLGTLSKLGIHILTQLFFIEPTKFCLGCW